MKISMSSAQQHSARPSFDNANKSNEFLVRSSEKIDESMDEQVATLESHGKDIAVAASAKGGVKSELDAASALTSLVRESPELKHTEAENEEVQPFEIPEKFTRSGRKKAIPFALRVSNFDPLNFVVFGFC